MFLSLSRGLLYQSAVRQTLWLLGLFSAISLVAWGATFLLVQREMLRVVDERLVQRMDIAIVALDAGQPLPELEDGETAEFVQTEMRDGFETRDAPGTETEMRYLLRTTAHGRLQVGENTELQEELQDILAGGMQLSLLATLLLTSLAGFALARRYQKRLDTIARGLARVARGNLAHQITLDGNDDLNLLADRINATTQRLESAMTSLRMQSSNIAHDLRTPLARLRAQFESHLDATRVSGRLVGPTELEAGLDQIDRITDTFEALLRLARIESGAGRDRFENLDLAALSDEIAETFRPVVEDAGQSLAVVTDDVAAVSGDRALLVQLLANLIQNALRHGAQNQTIVLRVHGTTVSISDEGPGIAIADRSKALQPLYQGENTRQGEGFGLGLSMVRAISELHGADLVLSDASNGGLCVTIRFPKITEL